MSNQSFYVYDRNIFGDEFFKKNIGFYLSRLNENDIHLYRKLSLNDMGCVDEVNYVKSKERRRVVFIGDSFTSGMDYLHSWFDILKIKLNGQVDVFNFGMPGAGPSNWIDKIDLIKEIKPDWVFICMVDNILFRPKIDFFVDKSEEYILCRYENFEEIYCKGLIWDGLRFDLMPSERAMLAEKFNSRKKESNSPSISKDFDSVFFKRNVAFLSDLLNVSGKNVILKFPSFNLFDEVEKVSKHNEAINRFEDRCYVIRDVRDDLLEYKKEDLYLDYHWNLLGNSIVANLIQKEITNMMIRGVL